MHSYLIVDGWAGLISWTLRYRSKSTSGAIAGLFRMQMGFMQMNVLVMFDMMFVLCVVRMMWMVFDFMFMSSFNLNTIFSDLMWIGGGIFIFIIFIVFLLAQIRANILYWCHNLRMTTCFTNICSINCRKWITGTHSVAHNLMWITNGGKNFMSWKPKLCRSKNNSPKHKYRTIAAVNTFIFIAFRWWFYYVLIMLGMDTMMLLLIKM